MAGPSLETPIAPPPPEAPKPKEISPVLKKELSTVAKAIIRNHAGQTKASENDQAAQSAKSPNPAIDSLSNLLQLPVGKLSNPTEYLQPLEIIDSSGTKIKRILGRNNGTLECDVEGQGPIAISREAVFNAQLVKTIDSVLASGDLSEQERRVLETQVNILKGNADTVPQDGLDRTIIEAAIKNGLITTESLRMFIDRNKPKEGSLEDNLERLQAIAAIRNFEGKNLVDFDTMVITLKTLGLENKLKKIPEINKKLEDLRKIVPKNAQHKYEIEDEVFAYEELLSKLNRFQAALGENGPLKQIFDSISDGSFEPVQIQNFNQALRDGTPETFIKAIYPELQEKPEDLPSVKKRKADKMSALKKAGFTGGLLIFLFMMQMKSKGGQSAYGY